jgi:small subunit ribosomal protein S8
MPVTDPIADMLTCIRNAAMAGHRRVDVPKSKIKLAIAQLLEQEKYIASWKAIDDDNQGLIRMYLRYNKDQKPIIRTLSRVSKPGRRVYVRQEDVPQVLSGLGTAIISTSEGILTGKEAVKRGLGGELVATIS